MKVHRFSVKGEALRLSLQRSDMSIEGDTSNLRAPVALNPDLIGEERNVYSTSVNQFPQAPVALNPDLIGAGRHVCRKFGYF